MSRARGNVEEFYRGHLRRMVGDEKLAQIDADIDRACSTRTCGARCNLGHACIRDAGPRHGGMHFDGRRYWPIIRREESAT